MTSSLLYISYSSSLTEKDKLEIDKSVCENRKNVIKFIYAIGFAGLVSFGSRVKTADAMGLGSIPQPAPITRNLSYNYNPSRSTKFVPTSLGVEVLKKDKITFNSPPNLIYVPGFGYIYTDQVLKNNIRNLKYKSISELRGGNNTIIIMGIIVFTLVAVSSFVIQEQRAQGMYGNQGIYGNLVSQSISRNIGNYSQPQTLILKAVDSNSNECSSYNNYTNKIQKFLIDGVFDAQSAYAELTNRMVEFAIDLAWQKLRERVVGEVVGMAMNQAGTTIVNEVEKILNKHHCTFERFLDLSMENGVREEKNVREAFSIVMSEMLGYFTNSRRPHYGRGIAGPDFIVDGLGEYKDVTHAETKNPVGSCYPKPKMKKKITKNDLMKQGKNIGLKLVNQQEKWSNTTFLNGLPHRNISESFPKSEKNTIGLCDLYDVPKLERPIIKGSILDNVKNKSNVIFINDK